MSKLPSKNYVIGIDGGGTKTIAAIANLEGKILAFGKSGPSGPRNVGIETAVKNIAAAIERVLANIGKDKKILSIYIGLAGVEEEFKFKKAEIKKELLKYKEISKALKGKVVIGSDQIAAFRAGTDEKNGIILIAGTGTSCHGWRDKKEVKISGWGHLADEGSALSVGRKVFQAIFRELDGRGPKTILTNLIFRKLKVKIKEELLSKVYSPRTRINSVRGRENWAEIIPPFSVFCDTASKRGDNISKKIMEEAGKELALSVKTAIKKLNFRKVKFSLVMVGGMFKSKIVLEIVKKEVKKAAPNVQFVSATKTPVIGAIKLTIESLKLK